MFKCPQCNPKYNRGFNILLKSMSPVFRDWTMSLYFLIHQKFWRTLVGNNLVQVLKNTGNLSNERVQVFFCFLKPLSVLGFLISCIIAAFQSSSLVFPCHNFLNVAFFNISYHYLIIQDDECGMSCERNFVIIQPPSKSLRISQNNSFIFKQEQHDPTQSKIYIIIHKPFNYHIIEYLIKGLISNCFAWDHAAPI